MSVRIAPQPGNEPDPVGPGPEDVIGEGGSYEGAYQRAMLQVPDGWRALHVRVLDEEPEQP